jgi:hypothetical protein
LLLVTTVLFFSYLLAGAGIIHSFLDVGLDSGLNLTALNRSSSSS